MYLRSIVSVITIICFAKNTSAQNDSSHFYIDGTLSGDSMKFITLSYTDNTGKRVTDTGEVHNHRFIFKGNISEPVYAVLIGNIRNKPVPVDDPNFTDMYIEPRKMKLELEKNHFKTLKLYGSTTQSQYDSLHAMELSVLTQRAPLDSEAQRLSDSVKFFYKIGDTITANKIQARRYNLIADDIRPYTDKQNNIEKKFINDNTNSYVSAYLLYNQFQVYHLSNDSVWYYYNKFPSNIQNSDWGKETKKWLGDIVPIGSAFRNINGIDNNDKKTSSDSLLQNNDYTLVIFWASWCVPCRQLNPVYHKIFTGYNKKGLKFIAVTLDDNKTKWLRAIKDDNTAAWQHVYSGESYGLTEKYGLSSIPADFLLKGNKVIAKYRGANNDKSDTDDLENKLKEIYKEN